MAAATGVNSAAMRVDQWAPVQVEQMAEQSAGYWAVQWESAPAAQRAAYLVET